MSTLVLGAAIVGALYLLLAGQGGEQQRAELDRLRRDFEQLQETVASQQPPQPPASPVRAHPPAVPPAASGPQSSEAARTTIDEARTLTGERPVQPTPEEEDAAGRRLMARYQEALLHEPIDEAWASEQESRIAEALAEEAFAGTSLSSVSCMSTLCNITSVHEDQLAFHTWMSNFPKRVGPDMPQQVTYRSINEDGSVTTESYFSRTGYELPRFSENEG